ncbi:MAG: radical SAM protein [Deltaproteobacteria bacterium]|nr:radical SAM protein [Deltaproteobacteria bacterium]
MVKLYNKEHDFSSKLRQSSVIKRLKEYISWRRSFGASDNSDAFPDYGPLSINLDLTTACNFSCPHCVDSKIINAGKILNTDDVKQTIDTLKSHGLRSVILIGGGEPTLHRDFEKIVRHLKNRKMQVGIVTNGSRLHLIKNTAKILEKNDWLRISIDAATEKIFARSHNPKNSITLKTILSNAREFKKLNARVSMGYSFVIVWEGIYINGRELCPNIDEIPEAVRLAKEHDFDYISFKPCLLKLDFSQKESLFDPPDKKREKKVIEKIKINLQKAKKTANKKIKILESINLSELISGKVHEMKKQPKICHAQFFRTVVTPSGIFHCPAFRGADKAKIAEHNGYDNKNFNTSQIKLSRSIANFDAEQECSVIACFYHYLNWWIENFIHSNKNLDELEKLSDENFFL